MIRDRNTGLLLGAALLVAGWLCIHDVTKRRGSKVPVVMRPFYPWG